MLVLPAVGVDRQLTGVTACGLRGSTRGIGVVGNLVDRAARLAVRPLFGAALARSAVDEGQLVVVDHDRASVAVHLQPGAEPRVRGGGGMQHTEGAILESDYTDGNVFDLDPFVGERSRVGEDLDG